MKLCHYELKKLLLTQKCLWILLICLVLKLVFLMAVPEMKDSRIVLSQKQYDKYLERLYRENTAEKIAYIKEEWENCRIILASKEEKERAYQSGEMSEDEWNAYIEEYEWADMHKNALEIFNEKAEQFSGQPEGVEPAHYIYEYGWQTIFSLQQFPDIFLLVGVVLAAVKCFSAEAASGMLPILLATRNGRQQLFRAKLGALVLLSAVATVVSAAIEVVVFVGKGWCNDSNVPIYSITFFAVDCPLRVTLGQGLALSLLVRGVATLLFAVWLFACSVWIKNATNLLFLAVSMIVVPLFLSEIGSAALTFTHAILLSGSKMLLALGRFDLHGGLVVGIVTLYSLALVWLAERRMQKGI